jgi:proteasome lid subunit RPN8/RPN11
VTKLGGEPKIHLSEKLLWQLDKIATDRLPNEACGVLLPLPWNGSQIIELPNRSLRPHDEYVIWPDDVEVALGEWAHSVDHEARDAVAVWHTHPAGNIGPSPGDLKKRIDGAAYLVLAYTGEAWIPTWF